MIYGETYVPAKEVEKIKGDSITGAFTNISTENRKKKGNKYIVNRMHITWESRGKKENKDPLKSK